ncbi:hypothetical protein Pcinc_034861 [Petrolisthes cinctipes]|uniref:Ig-like domain-containing protein n=1 Tax=Petrolisthes cinctipes TaxID=88211 RepID=A0AAE1C1M9_PETCI|nr:hypothetical protein Pcinc_034861 [Petrolisthes cinctipes]
MLNSSGFADFQVPPVDVRILGFAGSASAGSELRLVCRAAGSHPPAEVSWWRGHNKFKQVTHAVSRAGMDCFGSE